jgi:CheY-like chemotaxis protein
MLGSFGDEARGSLASTPAASQREGVSALAQILVVDDDSSIRTLIAEILGNEGHAIAQAHDGAHALLRVEQALPDLIVLDLAMPHVDGWHFLDELHRRGLRSGTRVIIVSGYYDRAAVAADHRSTPGCFLPKPFAPDELVRMVNDALTYEPEELYALRARVGTLARLMSKMDGLLD